MTDERRYDISDEEAATPGEQRVIRYTVREKQEDGTYVNAADFSSYDDWEFYLMPNLHVAGSTQAARRAAAVFYIPADDIDVATAPYAVVTLPAGSTEAVEAGNRAHELWASVNGGTIRLSYGKFPFVV